MKAHCLFLYIAGIALAGAQGRPVDPFGDNPPPLRVGLIAEPGKKSDLEFKLRATRIPLVEFVETPLDVALDFLRVKAEEHDLSAIDPTARGVNIVMRTPRGWPGSGVSLDDDKAFTLSMDDSPRITLKLKNASLGGAIRYVAFAAGLEMHVESEAVVLMPPGTDEVAGVVKVLEEASIAVEGWDDGTLRVGNSEVSFPRTSLLEALQSEYRRLRGLEARGGLTVEEAGVVARRLEATDRAIEKARKLLLDHWEAERELGEAWEGEMAQ